MTSGENVGPALVLGPMLRYAGETEATVWVETDRECLVEILGRQARTFEVAGHHYGLVVLDGLTPGSEQEYAVTLDGIVRWPLADGGFPPSVLRTLGRDRPVRLAFGSCRVAQIAPRNLDRRARRYGAEGVDALAALAAELRDIPRDRWPDVLLMIGDQVYADEPGPATRQFIAERRGPAADPAASPQPPVTPSVGAPSAGAPPLGAPPLDEIADFEEYCALYREAWSDPEVRWLFSVIPTAMIFDDHDVHDDWNTSAAWRRDVTALPWWGSRIEGAFQSYWVYQHLGNLSPAELARDEMWGKLRQGGDAAQLLADLAHRADQREPGIRWSFRRAFGRVRLVMLDSRSRRVVDGTRLMTDEGEWQWLTESVSGDWQHVIIATSVPPLLPRGIHALEAWTERLADGAWGERGARFGERLRRAVDLEHWPAFGASFARLERLLKELAAGQHATHGDPPASVTVISGDVHHSYLAVVDLSGPAPEEGSGQEATGQETARKSAVHEVVCSPFHQAMPPKMRFAQQLASSWASGRVGTIAAKLAGASLPGIRWRVTAGPWFQNMIAVLEFDGPESGGTGARVRFDRSVADASGTPHLSTAAEARLS
ncbi:MAG TPA: alkaline phosphatase D family protein [Trebonia sp.]